MQMLHPYSRPLNTLDLIENFLEIVLEDNKSKDTTLLTLIKNGEAELRNYDSSSSTYLYTTHRDRNYKTTSVRWDLRNQIVKELSTLNKLIDDDSITLEKGGALPESGCKSDNQAFIIIGLPASGKSQISNDIAEKYGAVILDSDFAKRKLPEFKDNPAGASLVHEESDIIIFGADNVRNDFKCLFELCVQKRNNIVIPKIGHNADSIYKLAKTLKNIHGYEVHLILVSLDRRKATIRAIERYQKHRRYVPLSLIFDGYGNEPILTYYRLKDNIKKDPIIFSSFGKISTDVPKGEKNIVVQCDNNSPVSLFQN